MSLAASLFQKDLYQLTLQDLEQFFLIEQCETSLLEFKRGDVEPEKIHKEVCAFLNTEGGLLIIGAPEESKTEKGKCSGALTPAIYKKTVDSIIQSIATGISPSPVGIKGHQIDTGNGWIHLLEILQSTIPPHQVNGEGKYYIRLEKEAKPAPHGIVEALFNRRQKPKLKMELYIEPVYENSSIEQKLSGIIANESEVTAEYTSYLIEVTGDVNVVRQSNKCLVQPIKRGVRIENPQNSWVPLVKGLSLFFDAEIRMHCNHMMVNALCWSKDATLVQVLGIYSKAEHSFTHQYSSREQYNPYTPEEIRILFDKLYK